jgi:hypothetical protein
MEEEAQDIDELSVDLAELESSSTSFELSSKEEDQSCKSAITESQHRPKPLYEGALLSVPASNVLLYKFTMRHNLSNEGLSDLLKLVALHCPTSNNCVGSVFLLKKHFGASKLKTKFHYFCGTCYISVDEAAYLCPNPDCGEDLASNGAMASFIELSIEQQLEKILSRKLQVIGTCVHQHH